MLHQQQWAKRLTQAVVAASALIGLAWGSHSVVHASTLPFQIFLNGKVS